MDLYKSLLKDLDGRHMLTIDYVISQRTWIFKKGKTITDEMIKEINSQVFSFDTMGILTEDNYSAKLIADLIGTKVEGVLPDKYKLRTTGKEIVVKPAEVPLWSLQAFCGIDTVLENFAPEEVLFSFVCLLNEISMVIVSEDLSKLTQTV